MTTYKVIFCDCGRIHFVDNTSFDNKKFYDGKEILHICTNCGNVISFGYGKSEMHGDYKHYSRQHYYETVMEGEKFFKILVSPGYQVPMMSGECASDFRFGLLIDESGLLKELGTRKLEKIDSLFAWGEGGINIHEVKAVNVDMNRIMQELSTEKLQSLSQEWCRSLNWQGTKYAIK